jgi:nitrite reductase (NO-forming)
MYHCGTPMILEHIASGMYGALVVEPREGYPTKVNREYVVIQSEFYAKAPPKGKKGGAQNMVYTLDGERLRNAQPTHTVFNGVHNGMVGNPLPASPGERVRLFVLNVGPSRTSSFHVVGTIFDRVWIDGNPDNQFRGMQTVLLGSSQAAIVEFVIPEPGSYIMVDHHFANASQGAIGLVSTEAKPARTELEHHNLAASLSPTEPEAIAGKHDFESKCFACHSMGQGRKLGPDLAGLTKRRNADWITRWLKSPEEMIAKDAQAKALLKEYNGVPMPNQNLSDQEIKQYLEYFKWYDAQPAGSVQSSNAGH